MPLHDLLNIPEHEIVPGYHGRFVHAEHVTMAYWQIDRGAALPEHSHPQEQITNLVTGEFELTVEGVAHHLKPGMVFVIPGGVPHAGQALTNCQIIDVFHPVREDYRK
jgi:quercetin dioxygenase-like cupin family protein